MRDTRLIKLMRCFTKKEFKAFGNFVISPFLKPARKQTIELYKYLIRFSPDFDLAEMSKEAAFNFIFEREKYDEKKINNLITDLTDSAENFLALSTLMNDELELKLSLSKGYLRKNLIDESNRVNIFIEKNIKPSFSPFEDYFSKLKRLNNLKFVYYYSKRDAAATSKCLENIFESSTLQFIFEYLNYIDNIDNSLNLINKGRDEKKIIQKIRQTINPEVALNLFRDIEYSSDYFNLHFYRFKTVLYKNNEKDYEVLKDVFFKMLELPENDKNSLDREERNLFFVYLINYCNQRLSSDAEKYTKEVLELNRQMLESDSYSSIKGVYLDVRLHRNMVLLCGTQKDDEFLKDLSEKYINYLHPEFRDDMRNTGYARLEFSKKNFEKCLEHLSKIKNYSIPMFKTDVKNLQLKTYYELSCYEQAFSLIDAYKSYLASTDEIDEVFKSAYKNFVDLCFELLKIQSGKEIDNVGIIKERIKNEAHPGFKPWLLEKANELG